MMKMKGIYGFLLLCLAGCSFVSNNNKANSVYSVPTQEEREEYSMNDKYEVNQKFQEYIQKGYIELGMTRDDVRASWGNPKTIKRKKTSEYDEVWVYVPNWKFRDKLYFNKGILVKTEPDYLVVSRMEGHGVMGHKEDIK